MSRIKSITIFFLPFIIFGCKKNSTGPGINTMLAEADSFIQYTIPQGAHYADKTILKQVELKELKFRVRFDSTAIYTTTIAVNQLDINKLYGFSDGGDHHLNSARIGWGWSNNALRLYAYAYTSGVREFVEITTVPLGAIINCSVGVSANKYLFTVNGIKQELVRTNNSEVVTGYQLYPYFGGDEVAPHEIHIAIMEIK